MTLPLTPGQEAEYAQGVAVCLRAGRFIRVVNYHNTLARDAERLRREIAAFRENFVPVSLADLDQLFKTGKWPYDKPGLIPAVYEGWRSGYDVMARLLKEAGFRGWFYIPAFFPDVPVSDQEAFCQPHGLRLFGKEDYPDGRYAMSWAEIREVARDHEVLCHTGTHSCITDRMSDEMLRREIIGSKQRLEEQIGREVPVFCWRSGTEYRNCGYAHRYLEQAGYRYVVSNLRIEKIR